MLVTESVLRTWWYNGDHKGTFFQRGFFLLVVAFINARWSSTTCAADCWREDGRKREERVDNKKVSTNEAEVRIAYCRPLRVIPGQLTGRALLLSSLPSLSSPSLSSSSLSSSSLSLSSETTMVLSDEESEEAGGVQD